MGRDVEALVIEQAVLLSWAIRASSVATHGAHALPPDVAQGMVDAALANPLTSSDDGLRTTLALEVAIAFFESGGQMVLNPVGPNDGGRSHCWAQAYIPAPQRTIEGWLGVELRSDPLKCATVAVRFIKGSVLASPHCEGCELVVYARGKDTEEARALSRNRVRLAKRLLLEVPLEVTP